MPNLRYFTRVLHGMRFKKLNQMLRVVKDKSGHCKVRTLCDMAWCALRYGAGYYDYVMYGFYDMNGRQRDTYLTRLRNKKVCDLMNQAGFSDEFDDKLRFNVRFAGFLQRETLNAELASADELSGFLQRHPVFLAKPNRGTCGNGIEKLKAAQFASASDCAEYLAGKHLNVLEEPLAQHEQMARLHPQSVNTLRIVTDRVGDTVHIAYIVLKIGRGGSFCDNSGQGGVICRVDAGSGKICSVATDDYFEIFETHPDTGIRFEGYRLPMVPEAIALAKRAALVVPEIRHVGWDVAITPQGPVLIEGNDYPGTDLCQLAPHYPEKQGLWPYYKKILNLKK